MNLKMCIIDNYDTAEFICFAIEKILITFNFFKQTCHF